MTEKELKERMSLLEAQGWQPQLCDTPIPLYTKEPFLYNIRRGKVAWVVEQQEFHDIVLCE